MPWNSNSRLQPKRLFDDSYCKSVPKSVSSRSRTILCLVNLLLTATCLKSDWLIKWPFTIDTYWLDQSTRLNRSSKIDKKRPLGLHSCGMPNKKKQGCVGSGAFSQAVSLLVHNKIKPSADHLGLIRLFVLVFLILNNVPCGGTGAMKRHFFGQPLKYFSWPG